jgi:hypothetical protein
MPSRRKLGGSAMPLDTTRAPHNAISTRDHIRLIRLRALFPAKGKITSTITTPNSTCAETTTARNGASSHCIVWQRYDRT